MRGWRGKRVRPRRFRPSADVLTDPGLLRQAADELDSLWRIRAVDGSCDSLGGTEYERVSLAPRLRRLADNLEAAS